MVGRTQAGPAHAAFAASAGAPIPCFGSGIIAGKNFKAHWQSHRRLLENLLNKKYPKWKVDEGAEFLDDMHELVKSGRLKYQGMGTIKKDFPACHIFRGEGLTMVTKESGEFVTLLESGTGMDLGIVLVR